MGVYKLKEKRDFDFIPTNTQVAQICLMGKRNAI
jgi:hypothetical protein